MNNNFGMGGDISSLLLLLPAITKDASMFIPLLILIGKAISFLIKNKYMIDNYFNNYTYYIIESHIVPIVHFDMRYEKPCYKLKYSDDFKAIIHYIQINFKDLHFDNLHEILENNGDLQSRQSIVNNNNKNKKKKDNYINLPLYTKQTLISSKYNIYMKLYDFTDEDKNNITGYRLHLFKKKEKNINNLIIIKQFINECNNEYNKYLDSLEKDKQLYIYQYNCLDDELKFDKYEMQHNKNYLSNIFIENKEHLFNYFKAFINLEYIDKYNQEDINYHKQQLQKYNRSGFTFKCGMLFYGTAGCGKTSTIKSILKYTNRQGIMINLEKVKSSRELELIFRNRNINGTTYKASELCYILEDCDATQDSFIRSRKLKIKENNTDNKTNETKNTEENYVSKSKNTDDINLTCFLNILDGIIELNDIMIIMTTNHPELIDEALIRPGRIDYKYEFKKATREIIVDMLSFKFEINSSIIKSHSNYNKLKDYKLSQAQIQAIIFQNSYEDAFNKIIELC